jgi:class 3 adenylate cyclase
MCECITVSIYYQIVNIIIEFKGDIIKFAGDAVVVYWKSELDQEELDARMKKPCMREQSNACACARCVKGSVVLQACKCCLELLKQLGRYKVDIPDCEITELKIHLGIGAGQIYDVHVVGDETRNEHFIAGDGVNQLSVVLDLAKPGKFC